ncbi:MAG: DUF302 domain-containing protein [Candidatus Diapherotrites archaeon]|uniref:DUF302 domain-containing protein n=1 Tax=Candidatus Iainarchaeum sp. TaxID=3101447 RepID=A0A8T3YJ45_9ARCH|nr:DUF302 domain-containing protein [Candidatus Diapherotrites archaeon]
MNAADFMHVAQTTKAFDDAVVSVLKAVEKKGWALFGVYDVKERLAAKGFAQQPLKIIEICSARHANGFLGKNRLSSLCMPCRINVLQENHAVKIVAMRPAMVSAFFPEIGESGSAEAEKDIKEIITGVAKS